MERKYTYINGFSDFQKYFLLNRTNYPFNSPVTSYHFLANLDSEVNLKGRRTVRIVIQRSTVGHAHLSQF